VAMGMEINANHFSIFFVGIIALLLLYPYAKIPATKKAKSKLMKNALTNSTRFEFPVMIKGIIPNVNRIINTMKKAFKIFLSFSVIF
jgi:hypothetical protein